MAEGPPHHHAYGAPVLVAPAHLLSLRYGTGVSARHAGCLSARHQTLTAAPRFTGLICDLEGASLAVAPLSPSCLAMMLMPRGVTT